MFVHCDPPETQTWGWRKTPFSTRFGTQHQDAEGGLGGLENSPWCRVCGGVVLVGPPGNSQRELESFMRWAQILDPGQGLHTWDDRMWEQDPLKTSLSPLIVHDLPSREDHSWGCGVSGAEISISCHWPSSLVKLLRKKEAEGCCLTVAHNCVLTCEN